MPSGLVVGWRVWWVERRELCSLAREYRWKPGENAATCLAGEQVPCSLSPGRSCRCGFWALFSPRAAMHLVSPAQDHRRAVFGLISGYGTIALHGTEGFRAEFATIACLFPDRIGESVRLERARRRRYVDAGETMNQLIDSSTDPLKAVADRYGVLLVPLKTALSIGLLDELGATIEATQEVQALFTSYHQLAFAMS